MPALELLHGKHKQLRYVQRLGSVPPPIPISSAASIAAATLATALPSPALAAADF